MSYRKNLSKVKKALKALNDKEESEITSNATSINDVKALLKSQEEKNKNNLENRNKLKKAMKKEKHVVIRWNIEPGDLVQFDDRQNKNHVGLVIMQNANGKFRSAKRAKFAGKVLVMSSAGRTWLNPKNLEKID